MFSESLEQNKDLLIAGSSVLLNVTAENKPEGISLRVNSVRSLEAEAGRVHKQLNIFVRDEQPLGSIAQRIKGQGEGSVSVIVLHGQGEREVEIGLPGRRMISPQIAGALKAIPGVVAVELVET